MSSEEHFMAADSDFKKHFTLLLKQPDSTKVVVVGSQIDDAGDESSDEDDSTKPSLYTLEDSRT